MMLLAGPNEAEFQRMVIVVAVTGLVGFGLSGGLLWLFWRSLKKEHEEGRQRLTPRSALLLVAVIASLILVSLVFVGISYFG